MAESWHHFLVFFVLFLTSDVFNLLRSSWYGMGRNRVNFLFWSVQRPKNIGTDQFFSCSISGHTWSHSIRLNSCVNTFKMLLWTMMKCFVFRSYSICASISLNKHAVDMFNELLFSLGDFEKSAFPAHTLRHRWSVSPNFACMVHIRKSFNFDPIFGKKHTEFALMRSMPTIGLNNCDTIAISQLKILKLCARTMSFCVIFAHFVDQSFLAVHQTLSKSGYLMKGLKECHPKRLKR